MDTAGRALAMGIAFAALHICRHSAELWAPSRSFIERNRGTLGVWGKTTLLTAVVLVEEAARIATASLWPQARLAWSLVFAALRITDHVNASGPLSPKLAHLFLVGLLGWTLWPLSFLHGFALHFVVKGTGNLLWFAALGVALRGSTHTERPITRKQGDDVADAEVESLKCLAARLAATTVAK
jgi:hypothetical protein